MAWKSQFLLNYILYDSIILYPLNGKTTETDKRLVAARACRWEKRGEWGYKKATQEAPVMMGLFCILIISKRTDLRVYTA